MTLWFISQNSNNEADNNEKLRILGNILALSGNIQLRAFFTASEEDRRQSFLSAFLGTLCNMGTERLSTSYKSISLTRRVIYLWGDFGH